jgi:octaprenyl-diphosphate synthase
MSSDVGVWLSNELSSVSDLLDQHLESRHEAVNDVCRHISRYRGKMLRPSLVLLSWKAVKEGSDLPESLHCAAAVVELIHLATLVHDDVLDEAEIRRGGQTINSLWGNEGAVMLGDYLLSSAFHLCSTARCPDLNILLGEVTNTLCAGELVQLYHRNDVKLTLQEYYQIIHDKTASLISASCKIGGIIGDGTEQVVHSLGVYGESIGTAFQIRDDLIDILSDEGAAGKPTGRDVAKGKMTLPAILMLKNNPDCFDQLAKIVKDDNPFELKKMLIETSSIEQAEVVIQNLVNKAVDSVGSFSETPSRRLLVTLAQQLTKPITC